jgi:hypothetical protein
MQFTSGATLKVLELVQLSMARVPAPSGAFAGIAGLELMRFSMACRTEHTQLCQLRAVTWRLRSEQSIVASLQQTLDEAADSILDLEDHRDELYYEVDYLAESLRTLRMTSDVVIPTRARESVYVVD